MNTPLEKLKLKLEFAQLEVQWAEQRKDLVSLILKARQIILAETPSVDFELNRQAWLNQTSKFFP